MTPLLRHESKTGWIAPVIVSYKSSTSFGTQSATREYNCQVVTSSRGTLEQNSKILENRALIVNRLHQTPQMCHTTLS